MVGPFTYASIPNQGVIKTTSATVQARTNQYSFIMTANDAFCLSVANVNRTSLTVSNQDPLITIFYTYINNFVAADPTVTPAGGTAGLTIVALGTAPVYPDTGGNTAFPLYKKLGSPGVFSIDTNWALVTVTTVGYPILAQQALNLDNLQNIFIGATVGATIPVDIDEGASV